VSGKSARIAALIEGFRGRELDAHYLGYFECFNRTWFYEAHDVLEELWLADRHGPHGNFYKGLIQFAGAFVHLQKHSAKYPRLRPAAALLRLARGYLRPYAPRHERLDVDRLLEHAVDWEQAVEAGGYERNPILKRTPPRLELLPKAEGRAPEIERPIATTGEDEGEPGR
jgi:predicted metal-dependent hydrolase